MNCNFFSTKVIYFAFVSVTDQQSSLNAKWKMEMKNAISILINFTDLFIYTIGLKTNVYSNMLGQTRKFEALHKYSIVLLIMITFNEFFVYNEP